MHDLVVIGTGLSGYVCDIRAAQQGLKVAVIVRIKEGLEDPQRALLDL